MKAQNINLTNLKQNLKEAKHQKKIARISGTKNALIFVNNGLNLSHKIPKSSHF